MHALVNHICTLFAVLTGDEVELERVELPLAETGLPSKPATLYFKTDHARRSEHSLILFPLGQNLRYDTQKLPSLPLTAVEAFFALDEGRRGRFEKYVRYRRLQNVEERFLGYFRLLEALTKQSACYVDEKKLLALAKRARRYLTRTFGDKGGIESFLKRLPRFNRMKYNTERCLADFLDGIPEENRKRWKCGKDELMAICKWRNDLSHANEHAIDRQTSYGFAAFVEVLLVIRLLAELGVEPSDGATIAERLTSFHMVVKRA